jgi:hypothetical protein
MQAFTDVDVSVQNPVYNGATMEVTFTGISNIDVAWGSAGSYSDGNCYVTSAYHDGNNYTSCSATNLAVTVSNIKFGTNTIQFRIISIFNSSTNPGKIATAKTLQGTATIDHSTTGLASITKSTAYLGLAGNKIGIGQGGAADADALEAGQLEHAAYVSAGGATEGFRLAF